MKDKTEENAKQDKENRRMPDGEDQVHKFMSKYI